MRLLLPESAFVSMLYLERRRAERAKKRFVLVLVDVRKALSGVHKDRTLGALNHAISQNTRETDIIGWYVENDVIGLIGTELGQADNQLIQKTFLDKIRRVYGAVLGTERAASISRPRAGITSSSHSNSIPSLPTSLSAASLPMSPAFPTHRG